MKIQNRHFLGDGTAIAYPHCNGFVPGGRYLIYSRTKGLNNEQPCLLIRDLITGENRELPAFPIPAGAQLEANSVICFDVALTLPRVVGIVKSRVCVLDLSPVPEWRIVYDQPADAILQDLPGISPDGRRCLVGEDRPGMHSVVEVDLETLATRTLFKKNWHANHFHYCPHDPSWIGFAHEGPAEQIQDRCWAWHATLAPEGRVVFDQQAASDDPAQPLAVGHERWGFHALSAYVVAYAVSPVGKRGLYEIFADSRPARLLRETNTAWHCNMDASGRIAVMDTTAPWDRVPASGTEYESGVAGHLRADRERTPNLSDVVLLNLDTGEDLHVARVTRTRHPYHPHPALSPDAKWLTYTDASPESTGSYLVSLQNP